MQEYNGFYGSPNICVLNYFNFKLAPVQNVYRFCCRFFKFNVGRNKKEKKGDGFQAQNSTGK